MLKAAKTTVKLVTIPIILVMKSTITQLRHVVVNTRLAQSVEHETRNLRAMSVSRICGETLKKKILYFSVCFYCYQRQTSPFLR